MFLKKPLTRTAMMSASIAMGLTLIANSATAADPVTVVTWGGSYGDCLVP